MLVCDPVGSTLGSFGFFIYLHEGEFSCHAMEICGNFFCPRVPNNPGPLALLGLN